MGLRWCGLQTILVNIESTDWQSQLGQDRFGEVQSEQSKPESQPLNHGTADCQLTVDCRLSRLSTQVYFYCHCHCDHCENSCQESRVKGLNESWNWLYGLIMESCDNHVMLCVFITVSSHCITVITVITVHYCITLLWLCIVIITSMDHWPPLTLITPITDHWDHRVLDRRCHHNHRFIIAGPSSSHCRNRQAINLATGPPTSWML